MHRPSVILPRTQRVDYHARRAYVFTDWARSVRDPRRARERDHGDEVLDRRRRATLRRYGLVKTRCAACECCGVPELRCMSEGDISFSMI